MTFVQKHPAVLGTVACSFALSQPFFYYMAGPLQENDQLTESRSLVFGTHDEAVHALQKKLKRIKFYEGTTDGKFGIKTEHAVKQFQRRYNLDITGRANKETIHQLMEMERDYYLESLKSIDGPIYPGSRGKDVESLQLALYYFGLYEGEIDGIYGPLTKKAVTQFQTIYDLPIQSTVDEDFFKVLYTGDQKRISQKVILLKNQETSNITPLANHLNTATNTATNTSASSETDGNIGTSPTHASQGTGRLIQTARAYLGTPYVWGGESPQGFDCSGYLQFVYQSIGVSLPRTVDQIWSSTLPLKRPSVGDLVFFETYKPGPSHAGIYLGDGKFIHAGLDGVTISSLSNSYWKNRYLGARRVNQY